jgi:hypothetical protein
MSGVPDRSYWLTDDWRRSACLLVGFAAGISAVFAFLVFPHLVDPLHVHYMRADGYYDLAENLLSGRGFVFGEEPRFNAGAFKREPMYPLFLAAFLKFSGFPQTLIAAQIALFSCITFLSYQLFLRYGAEGRVAFWAAALFAAYPFSFWYVAKPTPENLSPIFLLLNAWLLQWYLSRPGIGRAAAWGLSWTLAVFAKSNLILLGPIGFLIMVIYGARRPIVLAHMVVAATVFVAGMSPWVARNYDLSGRFIWGSSMGGSSFFVGNRNADWESIKNLGTDLKGESTVDTEWKEEYYRNKAMVASPNPYRLEAKIDAAFDARVIPWIYENKAAFARKVLINAGTLWFISSDPAKSRILLVFQGPLMLAAFAGILLAIRRGLTPLEAYMALVMGSLYAVHSVILADARYTHVYLPFTAYFAVTTGVRLIRSPRAKST